MALTTNLVAAWSADEFRGVRDVAMLDLTGNGHHMGTIGNPQIADAAIGDGRAIKFDGSNNAQTPMGLGIDWSDDWSVSLWVRSTNTDFGAIVSRWNASASSRSWYLVSTNGTACRFYSGTATGAGAEILGSAPSLTLNTWHHLILSHDATANRVTIVLDGVSTLLDEDANITSYDLPLVIGDNGKPADSSGNGVNDGKECEIDEVYVWDRLLTSQEQTDMLTQASYPGTAYTVPTRKVYMIGGQSNADGRGTNHQVYTGGDGSLMLSRATSYDVSHIDYSLQAIDDPVGTGIASFQGSVWPLFANEIDEQIVVASYAIGGTDIAYWQKSGTLTSNRATPFGTLVFRSQIAACYGQIQSLLWWQGEDDVDDELDADTYRARLEQFALDYHSETGVMLQPAKLQLMDSATYDAATLAAINEAIEESWDSPAILPGPDLSSLDSDTLGDGVHIQSDTGLQSAAELWAAAVGGSTATYADASDVRFGVDRGDGTTGTCYVPTAAQVLSGVNVDATTGTIVLPSAASVLDSVSFGAASGTTGTYHAPSAGEVIDTAVFGPASGTSGTFEIPAESVVSIGIEYGAGGTEFTGTLTAGRGLTADEQATLANLKLMIDDSGDDPLFNATALGNVPSATQNGDAAAAAIERSDGMLKKVPKIGDRVRRVNQLNKHVDETLSEVPE